MKYPQLVSMPSAVSDWLEEQLEARGIDAVVYTRYVLSLLYRDPVDIICPDQDLHFTQPDKEVRRSSGAGRRRLRRSSGWRGHNLVDADKLKRSAAVECLMSASDQKCGIESLVDELCEKLKESNSGGGTHSQSKDLLPSLPETKPQQQDPAKRYYAAFPPLNRNNSSIDSSADLIDLIPKWFGSPKRRNSGRKQSGRAASYEEKLHCKVDLFESSMKARSAGKQRCYFPRGNKKELGYVRSNNKSTENNNNKNDGNIWGHLYLFNHGSNNIGSGKGKGGPISWSRAKDIIDIVNEQEELEEKSDWKVLDDDSLNMYEDLPVDIRGLLNSPSPPPEENVEMMNLANTSHTGDKIKNIANSIWSNENTFNTAPDSESFLDLKFSSITIEENETNAFLESFAKYQVESGDFFVAPNEKFQKWSDALETEGSDLSRSLLMLNHSKMSSFTEVIPRPGGGKADFGSGVRKNLTQESAEKKLDGGKSADEDLLHSGRSHFKPINEKIDTHNGGQYADGTTFMITSNTDNVSYKRSESGYFYLENVGDQGIPRKYTDYHRSLCSGEFPLKFSVRQNDKASQTDAAADPCAQITCCDEETESFYFPEDATLQSEEGEDDFTNDECYSCYSDNQNSTSVLLEIFGKLRNEKCNLCNGNNNSTWWDALPSDWTYSKNIDQQSIRDIWGDGVGSCAACCANSFPTTTQSQLREDITQDGEQLLSDLSSLQKSYMEELPVAEVTCNISELIGMKERKRRHSSINYDGASTAVGEGEERSFSFATRLEEDCLMKIATIPTLRSVTL